MIVRLVVAVDPLRQGTVTSKRPAPALAGIVTSAKSTELDGSTVVEPNAREVTVAEAELSTQEARIWTVEPGCAVVGLTCTKTALRALAGGALPCAAASAAAALFALCDISAQPLRAASAMPTTAMGNHVRVIRMLHRPPYSFPGRVPRSSQFGLRNPGILTGSTVLAGRLFDYVMRAAAVG